MHDTLRQRRLEHARRLHAPDGDTLLGRAGDVTGRRVLVIGTAVSALLCELTLSECRRVEALSPGCRVRAATADLVLLTDLPSGAATAVARQAANALAADGRLVARMSRHDRHAVREFRLALASCGFRAIDEVLTPSTRFLSASAPGLADASARHPISLV